MIKIVTLDDFNSCIDQEEAREIFSGMLYARSKGYGPDYPKHFLPFERTDFIDWHHIFCMETKEGLVPIGGMKQGALKRHDFYRQKLPLLALMNTFGESRHAQALEDLVQFHRENDMDLTYGAGLAVNKEFRGNKEFSNFIREVVAAFIYLDMHERDLATAITAAVPLFKTDRLFANVGYKPLCLNGESLPPVINQDTGFEILLMQLERDKLSSWAKECFEKHRALLESRRVIDKSCESPRKIA